MTPLLDHLQSFVGGTYTIDRELGGGGMSRVFLARETALERDVAIKVLPAELAERLSTERFVREIRLAASLQQANIVPVLAAGVAGDLPYYVMPFVEGRSLREFLNERPQLPVHEAVGILRDIARALSYAHGHGVVHRDIKPENVLLSGDTAVVTDFGIAKAVSASRTNAPNATLTEIGTSIGTPAYMAPEQAAADPHTDHRADIYAWGVIAYEMLAGHHPFGKKSAYEYRTAHMSEAPEPLGRIVKQVPANLSALVMRCLEKDPAARPGSATDLVQALHESTGRTSVDIASRSRWRLRLAIVAAVVLAAAGVGGAIWRSRSGAGAGAGAPGVTRLAVLPFENAGRSEDDYFAEGITDEVRGKLAALPGLQVVARSSSRSYLKSGKKAEDIARELGVEYLLTGTVQWEKNADGKSGRVRVSPELVQIRRNDAPIAKWRESFEAVLSNVFQVQADIARRVAQALDVAIGASDRARLAERPTTNLEAYDAYLQGEQASNGGAAGALPRLQQAIRFYERATNLDSTFVHAWVRLSITTSLLYVNSAPDPQLRRAARSAADRALAIAPQDAAGHTALASYFTLVEADLPRALAELTTSLAGTPNDAATFEAIATVEQAMSRWDEALAHQLRSATLDPRGVRTLGRAGLIYLWLRRYDDARMWLDRALAVSPTVPQSIQQRAMLDFAMGKFDEGRARFSRAPAGVNRDALIADVATFWDMGWALPDADQRRLVTLSPTFFNDDRGAWALAIMQAYALRKDAANARAFADSARMALEEQLRGTPDDAQTRVLLGLALAELGQRDAAIRDGEQAMKMLPISRDARTGPYIQHQLARIYIRTGEHDKAIDIIARLLTVPYYLSPGWLRVDPNFDPLRSNPRFARLVR